MIYYYALNDCCQCDINSLLALLKDKEYYINPDNKNFYKIDTENKILSGVSSIPEKTTIFSHYTSYRQLKELL